MASALKKTLTRLRSGVLRNWKGCPRVLPTANPKLPAAAVGLEGRCVRVIEGASRAPVTPVERLAVATLKREGPLRTEVLVDRLAHDLYLDALRRGGGVLDIGLFGASLFVPEVVGELEAGDGTLWKIEGE